MYRRWVKPAVLALLLAVSFLSLVAPVSAVSSGQTCKKVGLTATSKSRGKPIVLTCAKVKKKLLWVVKPTTTMPTTTTTVPATTEQEPSVLLVSNVGNSKSAKFLGISAGFMDPQRPNERSSGTPTLSVFSNSKKICRVSGEIVVFESVGNCDIALVLGVEKRSVRVRVKQLLPRSTVDRPGGNILDIKPMYITFKDGPDEHHDTDGVVAQMVSSSLDFMAEQNPGFKPRLDTFEGLPDVQYVQIPLTYEQFAARWTTTNGPLSEVLSEMGFPMVFPERTGRGYDKINRVYVALVEGSLPLKDSFSSGHTTPGCGTNANSGIAQYWLRQPDGTVCDWIVKSFNYKGSLDAEWNTEIVRHIVARQRMRTNVGCDEISNNYFSLPLAQLDGSIGRQDDPLTYKYVGKPKPPWVMDGNHNLYFKITSGPRAGNICDDLAYSPFWTQIGNGEQPSDVAPGRSFVDQPDDSSAAQVHVFYVLPKDVQERKFDIDGTFSGLITSTNEWLFAKGGKRLRFDTYKGELDITFVRLDETEGQLWMEADDSNTKCSSKRCPTLDTLKAMLVAKGFTSPIKAMLIYYGGAIVPSSRIVRLVCGTAGHARAAIMLVGQVDVMTGQFSCFGPTKTTLPESQNTSGLASFHELFHMLGAVGTSPNSDGNYGHIKNDNTDLMGKSEGIVRLDAGNDDYWHHGRSNFLDLYNSAFMDPQEPNAVMPVEW